MDLFYTYIWRDAKGIPFYVGKGRRKRVNNLSTRSAEFLAIHSEGGCSVEIVDEFIHEAEAHAHEVELIERYGRREFGGLLVNKTDGGEGVSGARASAETRKKQSAASKGIPKSLEHRKKQSEIMRLRHSQPEVRAKNISMNRMLPPSIRNKSGYKGVSFVSSIQKWVAALGISRKVRNLGYFKDAEQAARAYDAACIEAFGLGNCYLNFPPSAANDNDLLPTSKAA